MPSAIGKGAYIIMRKQTRDGASLYYVVDGESEPIILLHCLPMDHRVWTPQVFFLSPMFKTITPDFRGLGLSDRISNRAACSIKRLAEDVNEILEQENIQKVIIGGLSLGGMVAQQFAIDYPQKVRALILAGTTSTSKPASLKRNFEDRIKAYSSHDPKSYYEAHITSLFSPPFASSAEGKSIISSYTYFSDRVSFPSVVMLFKAILDFDLHDKLSSIQSQTLVVAGEKDLALPACAEIAELIPNAKFVKVAGAGHAVNMEKPSEFDAELLSFLNGVLRAS